MLAVELRFMPKDRYLALAAAEENKRHSAGRRARRDGTAETIVEPAAIEGLIARTTASLAAALKWPADDVMSEYDGDGEIYEIGRKHGGGHAVDRLARAYVAFMGDKRLELFGERLRSSWRGFCEAMAKQLEQV